MDARARNGLTEEDPDTRECSLSSGSCCCEFELTDEDPELRNSDDKQSDYNELNRALSEALAAEEKMLESAIEQQTYMLQENKQILPEQLRILKEMKDRVIAARKLREDTEQRLQMAEMHGFHASKDELYWLNEEAAVSCR